MARYVRFEIPNRELGKADVTFYVWDGDTRVGTLTVSKGSVVWFPKNKRWGHKFGWQRLASVLENAKGGARWERRR